MDDTVFFAALTPAQRKQLLAELTPELSRQVPFFRRAVLSAEGAAPRPPDARAPEPTEMASLSYLLRLEDEIERRASRLDIGESAVNVRFHWDTPFEVLLGVLTTAKRAGLNPWPIVEGLRREGVLQFVPEGIGERGCPAPQLQIGPLGVMVSIEPSAGFVLSAPDAGGKSQGPRWQRIVARDGACPSVPRKGGSLDFPAVTSLLREIAAQLPLCEEGGGVDSRTGHLALHTASRAPIDMVLIGADPRTPWQEIVASADAAADAGFPRPRFKALEPPGGCREAIQPGALRERLSRP